ncbi:MAG: DUF2914 domain-containing protein [Holophagaceae bacterium]|nr:DUF2914 domain-containing protein [Holophagaceae bacterium]
MRPKRLLPFLVAVPLVLAVAFVARAQAAKAKAPAGPATAEVKVGTGIEKMELKGEAKAFKVAAGAKIHAWTKVSGAADTTIAVVFTKGDKSSRQELKVPRSPYRTHAYRTFRMGDEGAWTAKVLAADGAELGKAEFTVEFQ